MKKIVKKTIDLNKKYNIPKLIKVVEHSGKFLVIAPNFGNWIVLENQDQLSFFDLLKNNSIGESLNLFFGKKQDAEQVIIQIEAKKFESKIVRKTDKKRVFIYLTNGCNMRCPHCYMYADYKKENELSDIEIIDFLTKCKSMGITKVTFSGGEVTTRNDFIKIINRTFELGFYIEVLTNGTLWTDEMISETASKISEIQISIDGYCEEENKRVRGAGNFERALDTVDKFVNLNVNTRIAITPFFDDKLENKSNEYVSFAKNLLNKYSEKRFEIIFSGDLLDGREINFSQLEKKRYSDIMGKIYDEVYPNSKNRSFIKRNREHEILDNCSFGNLYISSTGDVYACSRIPGMTPYANIRKDDFLKIERLSKIAQEISCIDNLRPCNNCELKYICGGGCRLVHFAELASIDDIESFNNSKTSQRKCNNKIKNSFYDLMIETNREIFQ